jgi:uncharacterized SAM-binding protein YcdF (DUF218 family)
VTPRLRRFLISAAILLVFGAFFHPVCLRTLGTVLVRDDGPERADIAVVLAGDNYGKRITRAAELVKAGYVPRVLVSGPTEFYGVPESQLAIDFAARQGFPKEWFLPYVFRANSTRDEARTLVPVMRRMGARSFLLVTSDYHTGRAGRIFAKACGDMKMRVIAAPDAQFHSFNWWRSRDGRKQWFFEWSKTVAEFVGL